MADLIRVFISHKKRLTPAGQPDLPGVRSREAEILWHVLTSHGGYQPWYDREGIPPGMRWEAEIYRALLRSDVMIVLIGPGTSDSTWVQREITLAKALGVTIIPIGFDGTRTQLMHEVTLLGIDDVQWIERDLALSEAAALLAGLDPILRRAVVATRERQRETLRELWERQRPKRRKAPDNQRAASFLMTGGAAGGATAATGGATTATAPGVGTLLHVASGDLSRTRNIDVIVNSENDYMQMARFFEAHTVSSTLRRRGSQMRQGRYLDTVQQELDWQLRDWGRPVPPSTVFPTSTGGPDSELARINRARVLLHVAAVQALDSESRVIPFKSPHQIETSVRNALTTLAELNRLDGVFSPEGTAQRAEQERLAKAGRGKLRSVIFPLLGTGQGGADPAEVIVSMVDGLVDFLSEPDNQETAATLGDVYISAYGQEDVEAVIGTLDQRFPRATG